MHARLNRDPRFRRRRMIAAVALLAIAALTGGVIEAAGDGVSATARAGEPAILQAAKLRNPPRYRYAVRTKARIELTSDRRSFTVSWLPGAPKGVIVTFPGFASTAFDQYALWRPYAARRGYGVIAVQWRRGFKISDYSYSPQAMYAFAARALTRSGARPGTVLLHGYSSSAIRTYALNALDRKRRRYFALTIANAGAAIGGFPGRSTIGRRGLAGTRWVLFCGLRDPHPDYSGCPAMRRTRSFIGARGGSVDRLLADPRAGHAGFFRHPSNVTRALDVYGRVLAGG